MRSHEMIPLIRTMARFVLLLLSCTLPVAAQNDPWTSQAGPRIKAAVDLVPLSVMVTDRGGRAITGLDREKFRVYEDRVEQEISFFSSEQAPVSWGLVLDRSGSMQKMIGDVYRAALHVVDDGSERDELFILSFNNKIEMLRDFSSDRQTLESAIVGLNGAGHTALYDAVAFALDYAQLGTHEKKALVVVTDGADNSSRLSFRDLMLKAGEHNVLIYTVGMGEGMADGFFGLGGHRTRKELKKLAEVTGATSHFPADEEQCRETMQTIAHHVGHQYRLAYYPSNPARDGQWRTIQIVSTTGMNGGSKYIARTRSGYYAPKAAPGQAAK